VSLDVVEPACIPVSTTTSTIAQVNSLAFNTSTCNGSVMYEKFSSTSGAATLFFDIASDPVFEVYQGTNPSGAGAVKVADSATAVALTQADSNLLLHDPAMSSFWLPASISGINYNFGGSTGYIITGNVGPNNLQRISGAWVQGSGKIEWTHDPSKGLYYFIKIYGILGGQNSTYHGNSSAWRYWAMLRYPTDIGATVTIIDPCGRTGAATGYTGTATVHYGKNSSTVPDGTMQFDSVVVQCRGLLPLTRHYLYVNGVKDTTDVRPWGGVAGDPIMSDSGGSLTAIYNLATTNWASREAELGLTVTPDTAALILNEGQTFAANFIGNAYMLFEVLAPNSRAGASLHYVPWSSF
jgi:hypothetical protein